MSFGFLFLLSVGCQSEESPPVFQWGIWDENIFFLAVGQDDVVTDSDGLEIAGNQFLIVLDPSCGTDPIPLIEQMTNSVLVGQVPDIHAYQFQLSTVPSETAVHAAITSLKSGIPCVRAALPNFVAPDVEDPVPTKHLGSKIWSGSQRYPCCPTTDADATGNDLVQCNLQNTEFFQALALLKTLKETFGIPLRPVSVGIADQPFYKISHELNGLRFNQRGQRNTFNFVTADKEFFSKTEEERQRYLGQSILPVEAKPPESDPIELHKWFLKMHGAVALVNLAADQNGVFPGGLLRAFLGDEFNILYAVTYFAGRGVVTRNELFGMIANLSAMIKVKKIPIAHVAFGTPVYVKPEVALLVSSFAESLLQSDTLLVVSGPHSTSPKPGIEYFPYFTNQSALVTKPEYLNHILTVAGFESVPDDQCSRQFWQNNVTPLAWQADLAAPATGHLVQLRPENQAMEEHEFVGTSFAIQYVVAAAALLKSVAPSLTAPEIKYYLTHNVLAVYTTNDNQEMIQLPSLSFSSPLLHLVWDTYCAQGVSSEACANLSSTPQPPFEGPIEAGVVVARTCGEVGMYVAPRFLPVLFFPSTEEMGMLGPDMMSGRLGLRHFATIDDAQTFQIGCDFDDVSWDVAALVENLDAGPGCMLTFTTVSPSGTRISGMSTGGTLRVEDCSMTDVMSETAGTLMGTAQLNLSFDGEMEQDECWGDTVPNCQRIATDFTGGGRMPVYIQIFNDPVAVSRVRELCR